MKRTLALVQVWFINVFRVLYMFISVSLIFQCWAAFIKHLLKYGARPPSLLEHKTAAQSLRERFDIRRTAKSYLEFSHSLEPSES